jgi:hypothetical protein
MIHKEENHDIAMIAIGCSFPFQVLGPEGRELFPYNKYKARVIKSQLRLGILIPIISSYA